MQWFSWAVALILLISSVVSPLLVTIENNKHQLKIKKLDMYEDSKRKALDKFIQASTNLHQNNSLGGIDTFNSSVNALYIYFENVPDNIVKLQDSRNSTNFFYELSTIVKTLSTQIAKN